MMKTKIIVLLAALMWVNGLFAQAESWPKALAYYNVGPTGYHSSWKMKRQGKKYAKQVKAHQENLKGAL